MRFLGMYLSFLSEKTRNCGAAYLDESVPLLLICPLCMHLLGSVCCVLDLPFKAGGAVVRLSGPCQWLPRDKPQNPLQLTWVPWQRVLPGKDFLPFSFRGSEQSHVPPFVQQHRVPQSFFSSPIPTCGLLSCHLVFAYP